MRAFDFNTPSIHEIRSTARRIARRIRPQRIVLFGSRAYGRPRLDSDVDLLVIANTSRPVHLAARIRSMIEGSFPVDVVVRTPREAARALRGQDPFLQEILTKGRILYESRRARVG